MADLDYSRVRAVVAESNVMVRQGVRYGLNALGVREIAETGSLTAAHQICRESEVDVLVINSLLEDNDATFMVRDIRAGRLGTDPFLPTILVLTHPTEPQVRAAMSCGTDDLLLVPFAPEQMSNRLRGITERRRPFVVTHDYMGPDRRKTPREGASSATQFNVPHPVRARATGVPAGRYFIQVDQFKETLGRERIRRLAHSVEYEFRDICSAGRDGSLNPDILIPKLFKLESICEELTERLPSVGASPDMVAAFLAVCKTMKSNASKVSYTELETAYADAKRITNTYVALPDSAAHRLAARA
ncbi:MAG: response regulator transcription factor [Magnetospirillum sp.]|nr:response regulator transcription factor [Magnetospirillum sp.]